MDRTTKILLAAIAVGLLANTAASLTGPATAQSMTQTLMESHFSDIANALTEIANGTCRNQKICTGWGGR